MLKDVEREIAGAQKEPDFSQIPKEIMGNPC